MPNASFRFSLTVVAASLAAIHGPAAADAEMDALTKPSSSISVGLGGWSNDRQQTSIYDGTDNRGVNLLFDADFQSRDDATGIWKTLFIRNMGLENRELRGDILEQGNWGLAFAYDELKSRAPYTINTKHLGIGTNTQTTGANIPNTAIGSGENYHFGTGRENTGFGFYKSLTPELDARIKVSTEDKKGDRITSNGSALFVADLIDWTTDKFDASLDYSGERLQVSGSYSVSRFKNNNSASHVSLGADYTTQPLNNEAHQIGLSGGYSFSPTTRSTFRLEYTQATQNDTLHALPASATFASIPGLNGKVNASLAQLGLTSRPVSRLSLVASMRHFDSRDKTPQYGIVLATDGATPITVNSTPFSFKTTSGKVEATYEIARGYSTAAGIDYSRQARTVHTLVGGATYNAYVPGRDELSETTYRLQLRKTLSESLNGSVAYHHSSRDGSDFSASSRTGTLFVSPVNSADRERDKAKLLLDWSPTEQLAVQLALEASRDTYGSDTRSHGLQEGRASLVSIDASYQISDDWQAAGWYSYNTNNARFMNFRDPATQAIQAQNDTGETMGMKITGKLTPKTQIGAEASLANDRSSFARQYTDGTTVAGIAPDISSRIRKFSIFASHQLKKAGELRFDVAQEQWKSNDWQWQLADGRAYQFGTASDGTTVMARSRQYATYVGARYIYRFQ